MATNNDETNDLDLDYYRYLRNSHIEASRSYDKTVLALAGGALGLSVTFVKDIAGSPPTGRVWLITGWISLSLCLAVMSFSFLSSGTTMKYAIEQDESKTDHWDSITRRLSLAAGLALALGLGALAVLAGINI